MKKEKQYSNVSEKNRLEEKVRKGDVFKMEKGSAEVLIRAIVDISSEKNC